MEKDKLSYGITHGLGPFFQNELADDIRSCEVYTASIDEALNKVVKKGQMDVMIRIWKDGEVHTRYLTSVSLEEAKALNILAALRVALVKNGLVLKCLLQISIDGPAVMLKFLSDLKTFLNDSPNEPKILGTGTCSLHIVSEVYRTALISTN
ncbi:hypothetical protein QAD02_007341 [Eretmocerus hayati]|uniref:Uncharacterized protein n=1 Tax=Eretmocerus hayati TaxID=131215 RepID=A0ACC2N3B7_9HYME|nr:hypothetical protein QAD02_007341 [Eretmocerus hayati]